MFDQREKIAIFIEGPNVYAASRNLELEIDYKRLLAYFRKKGYLLRAHYYTTLPDGDDYSSIRPLIDYLDYNGYRVVTKPVKTFTDEAGNRKFKGNMSVEIATDMLEMAGKADHLVLFSGDGDYASLVAAVQRKGSKVTVVSTLLGNAPMIGDELRKIADHFLELDSLRESIERS